MEEKENKNTTDIVVRALAIAGFLAVLGVGAWAGVKVVKLLPNAMSSLAAVTTTLTSIFIPNEKILINPLSSAVESNERFELSFAHERKRGAGTYSFLYSCEGEVLFSVLLEEDNKYSQLLCDTPFSFSDDKNSINLSIESEENRFIDVPVSVSYIRSDANNQREVSGTGLVTVFNRSSDLVDETTQKDQTITTRVPTVVEGAREDRVFPITNTVNDGPTDLTARVLSTGFVNKDTNTYTATTTVKTSDRVAVRFEIENIGGKPTGAWTFNVVLPTYPSHIFHSPTQQSLEPGDKIEFTMGFDSVIDAKEGEVIINVDPTGSINEGSEDNNIIKHKIAITQG